MTDDEQFFIANPQRRYRLRQAEPHEAQRIGVESGFVVAAKGGAKWFANCKAPVDNDANLSSFLFNHRMAQA